jgi:hypothetical protein
MFLLLPLVLETAATLLLPLLLLLLLLPMSLPLRPPLLLLLLSSLVAVLLPCRCRDSAASSELPAKQKSCCISAVLSATRRARTCS